jgi:hypothetical protein
MLIKIPIKRNNPIAKDLRTPKYKMRVVKSKKVYQRKPRHSSQVIYEKIC